MIWRWARTTASCPESLNQLAYNALFELCLAYHSRTVLRQIITLFHILFSTAESYSFYFQGHRTSFPLVMDPYSSMFERSASSRSGTPNLPTNGTNARRTLRSAIRGLIVLCAYILLSTWCRDEIYDALVTAMAAGHRAHWASYVVVVPLWGDHVASFVQICATWLLMRYKVALSGLSIVYCQGLSLLAGAEVSHPYYLRLSVCLTTL